MKNSQGLTLTYVLRITPYLSRIIIDREQEIIQNSPLHGNVFLRNTKKFLVVLKEIIVDTDSETWMKGKHCV